MDLVGKGGGLGLLARVEVALVPTVGHDGAAQLAAGELVEDQALFTGVDHLSVIKRGKLLGQLLLGGKLREGGEHLVVDGLGCKVVAQAAGHGDTVLFNALRALFAAHGVGQVHALERGKLFVRGQGVKIFPGNHRSIYPFIHGDIREIAFIVSHSARIVQ